MDWSNEQYVRIYLRDTATWLRLGWDGQCVLMQIMRKFDKAGVMDIADMEPWEAVVLHCRGPEEASKRGMVACIRLGVFEHNGAYLVAPNFRSAQEASKSDRQRQKEFRQKRRDAALAKKVTESDTVDSQKVTERHTESQPVTAGHSESLSAVQCINSAEHGNADVVTERDEVTPQQAHLIYCDATGRTDVGPEMNWRAKQSDALIEMARWANLNGGESALVAELERLNEDSFNRKQAIHVWSEKLGTGGSGSASENNRPEREDWKG